MSKFKKDYSGKIRYHLSKVISELAPENPNLDKVTKSIESLNYFVERQKTVQHENV